MKDPMALTDVRLPRTRDGEKGVFVSVNNLRYFVPRGRAVQVPRCIAQVLENSMAQDERTAQLIDRLSSRSDF